MPITSKTRPTLNISFISIRLVPNTIVLAAVATGLTALYRNEYALKGNVLIHLILALSAVTAMAVTALAGWSAVKNGKDRSGWLYWVALLISLLLVSIAGHWGGILVYG